MIVVEYNIRYCDSNIVMGTYTKEFTTKAKFEAWALMLDSMYNRYFYISLIDLYGECEETAVRVHQLYNSQGGPRVKWVRSGPVIGGLER